MYVYYMYYVENLDAKNDRKYTTRFIYPSIREQSQVEYEIQENYISNRKKYPLSQLP